MSEYFVKIIEESIPSNMIYSEKIVS